MRTLAAMCLLSLLAADLAAMPTRAAAPRDPLEAYWEREGFAPRNRWFGNVELSAKDVDELSLKIQKAMAAEGAKLTNVNTFDPDLQMRQPGQPRMPERRNFTYQVPPARAQAIADKIAALGSLQAYNVNANTNQMEPDVDPAAELKERIDAINAEMAAHADALKDMPIARTLYALKLERLKRAQASMEDNGTLQLTVGVVERGGPSGARSAGSQ